MCNKGKPDLNLYSKTTGGTCIGISYITEEGDNTFSSIHAIISSWHLAANDVLLVERYNGCEEVVQVYKMEKNVIATDAVFNVFDVDPTHSLIWLCIAFFITIGYSLLLVKLLKSFPQ
eukprot:9994606-Ditylum_brightwellii.AAC.1